MIRRGEIYWVNLDPTIGSEIKKLRPALIVSNDQNNQFANTVTVLPVTSKTHKIYPFEVAIKKGVGGLQVDSKVKVDQIRTVDKKRLIGNSLGVPSDEDIMEQVEKAMKLHLDIGGMPE